MTRERQQPPSFVVPPYFRLCALLAAAHISPPNDPRGYNDARRDLMLRFFKRKAVPSPCEFSEALAELYRLLDHAAWPLGRWVGAAQGDALMAAKLRLDEAMSEAQRSGLLDADGDERRADGRSARRPKRDDQGGWRGPAQ